MRPPPGCPATWARAAPDNAPGTQADAAPPGAAASGALALTSGFTSFIAHAGGPPVNAYVIPLRLTPLKFTATMAFFCVAVTGATFFSNGLNDGK